MVGLMCVGNMEGHPCLELAAPLYGHQRGVNIKDKRPTTGLQQLYSTRATRSMWASGRASGMAKWMGRGEWPRAGVSGEPGLLEHRIRGVQPRRHRALLFVSPAWWHCKSDTSGCGTQRSVSNNPHFSLQAKEAFEAAGVRTEGYRVKAFVLTLRI